MKIARNCVEGVLLTESYAKNFHIKVRTLPLAAAEIELGSSETESL